MAGDWAHQGGGGFRKRCGRSKTWLLMAVPGLGACRASETGTKVLRRQGQA